MNIGKGIVWAVVVVIGALIAGVLHIPPAFSFPWGMMTAAIAFLTTRNLDFSHSRFLGALLTMEKYRVPALVINLPLSLILLPLSVDHPWAFWVGISAAFVTIVIMISETIKGAKS